MSLQTGFEINTCQMQVKISCGGNVVKSQANLAGYFS